jgi:hypothetical protein
LRICLIAEGESAGSKRPDANSPRRLRLLDSSSVIDRFWGWPVLRGTVGGEGLTSIAPGTIW